MKYNCNCHACIKDFDLSLQGRPLNQVQMIVCKKCGNKRCPKAINHRFKCHGSNEVNQLEVLEPKEQLIEAAEKCADLFADNMSIDFENMPVACVKDLFLLAKEYVCLKDKSKVTPDSYILFTFDNHTHVSTALCKTVEEAVKMSTALIQAFPSYRFVLNSLGPSLKLTTHTIVTESKTIVKCQE